MLLQLIFVLYMLLSFFFTKRRLERYENLKMGTEGVVLHTPLTHHSLFVFYFVCWSFLSLCRLGTEEVELLRANPPASPPCSLLAYLVHYFIFVAFVFDYIALYERKIWK